MLSSRVALSRVVSISHRRVVNRKDKETGQKSFARLGLVHFSTVYLFQFSFALESESVELDSARNHAKGKLIAPFSISRHSPLSPPLPACAFAQESFPLL